MSSLLTELLGRGAGLPLAPDQGRLPRAEGAEKVRQSILIILDTEPGERVMLPEFGCGLRRFLMQPNSVATRAGIERAITDALRHWEKRITGVEVEAAPADDPSLVLVTLRYAHVATGRRDTLIYPLPLR
ncbi:GPW/gp25 family protein [Falsiroseomonas sp. HW251]|uniref:GPW/gp25 family protein n=1 Tax=Falsiroseomonas sp. HW251 TaxID=3390998 RepID=UPI003D31C20D